MLQGKHIVVGISGGIAAYKIPELIRELKKAGAEVKVTTTRHALEFVTELTLRSVSGYPVYSDVFAAINQHATEHISLPDWADLMIVAPATANVLGKMAAGIADDALTTTLAAMRKPIIVAPAMNTNMYLGDATQEAMHRLAQRDAVLLLDAAEGELACGTCGKGRMQEPQAIVQAAQYMLTPKDLAGQRILITAGPTQEQLDPVRYISNYSTGKMGYALARHAYNRGAEVVLISGPTALPKPDSVLTFVPQTGIQTIAVTSAEQMYQAALTHWPNATAAILSAAVADFAPHECAAHKIKKVPGQTQIMLELSTTPDIAAALGQSKQEGQTLIGFALETDHEIANACHKMESKHMDWIVLNSLNNAQSCFGFDTNQIVILGGDGSKKNYPLQTKEAVADHILDMLKR